MTSGSGDTEINLTPLLDVVLQLIMFFMITVNFVSVEKLSKHVRLPVAQALAPKEKEAPDKVDGLIYLNVNKDSEITGVRTLAPQEQTRGNIQTYLQAEMEQYFRKAKKEGRDKPKVILVLRADKDSRYTKVFDILEAGRQAGIESYQLRGISRVEKAEK